MELTDLNIFYSVFVFMWICYVWETYLSARQVHMHNNNFEYVYYRPSYSNGDRPV